MIKNKTIKIAENLLLLDSKRLEENFYKPFKNGIKSDYKFVDIVKNDLNAFDLIINFNKFAKKYKNLVFVFFAKKLIQKFIILMVFLPILLK